MKYMFLPFARATDFSGRSCRREYWMFMLFKVICFSLLGLGLSLTGAVASAPLFTNGFAAAMLGSMTVLAALALYGLVFLLPEIALTIRRWHDIGNSGWAIVVLLVVAVLPVIGWLAPIAHLVAMCLPGNRGRNKYGPNPANNPDLATAAPSAA